jgi:hypothetical protein
MRIGSKLVKFTNAYKIGIHGYDKLSACTPRVKIRNTTITHIKYRESGPVSLATSKNLIVTQQDRMNPAKQMSEREKIWL